MYLRPIVLLIAVSSALSIPYPYYDTQDFIYNVPKVYRISLTLDKLLDHYEKYPSRDPEWYITLGIARGQMEYILNVLDKSVPQLFKENLQNITRKMDRIKNNTDHSKLIHRSKDHEYVAKTLIANMEVLSSVVEPLTLGSLGTQNPYQFTFDQYVDETRKNILTRTVADSCMTQMLISSMESQTNESRETCDFTDKCKNQIMKGSALAFQQTSRMHAVLFAKLFNCVQGTDLNAHLYKVCLGMYKETRSLEAWNHPVGTNTLFMQQIFYCGSQGYGEFIKPRWMNKIIAWQEPRGCYADDRRSFLRLTGFLGKSPAPTKKEKEEREKKIKASDGVSCNSLTSALALGSLVLYTRALLETDNAFQYDILD